MKALLFAAGLGTRLYPLTKDKPKALAPFANTTLLAYNLKYLASQGIDSFIINTHHFADKIEKYLQENNYFGLDIYISYEKDLLDTAGGLANVRNKLKNEEQILLFNVDVISEINILKMYDYHCTENAKITLATRNRLTSRYLLFDNSKRMIGWKNENTGEVISFGDISGSFKQAFSGISIIDTNILHELGEVKKKSIIDFYLEICKKIKISFFEHNDEFWFDCGTIEKLKTAEKYLIENKKIELN